MSLYASAEPLFARHDLVMFDLDGVVYRGAQAIPHAVQTIAVVQAAGLPTAFLTNNASRTAPEVAAQIRGYGLDLADSDVVTAGEAISHIVAETVPPGSRVLVVGGPGLAVPLQALGLHCVASADEKPVAVVQGFHPEVGWQDLAEASYAIEGGAIWFASNTDQTFPTARGTAPGNGSLVEAVRRATGASPVVAGKPERGLFDETLRRTGAAKPLMVGDRIDTDIVGALRAGIDTLHVLTGISGILDLAELPSGSRPRYVSPDLRALLQPHPPVETDGLRAMCDSAVAEGVLDGGGAGEVRLTAGEPGSLAAVRAVVTCGWAIFDDTGRAPRPVGAALEH